jgi:hypothetical protein
MIPLRWLSDPRESLRLQGGREEDVGERLADVPTPGLSPADRLNPAGSRVRCRQTEFTARNTYKGGSTTVALHFVGETAARRSDGQAERGSEYRLLAAAKAPKRPQKRKSTAAAEDGEADDYIGDDEDHPAGSAGTRGSREAEDRCAD